MPKKRAAAALARDERVKCIVRVRIKLEYILLSKRYKSGTNDHRIYDVFEKRLAFVEKRIIELAIARIPKRMQVEGRWKS